METELLEDLFEILDARGFAIRNLSADSDVKLPPLIQKLNRKYKTKTQLKTDTAHLSKNVANKLYSFVKSDDPRLKQVDKKTISNCTKLWSRGMAKYISNTIIKHRDNGKIAEMKKEIRGHVIHCVPKGL